LMRKQRKRKGNYFTDGFVNLCSDYELLPLSRQLVSGFS
jgi:hypothetical protein